MKVPFLDQHPIQRDYGIHEGDLCLSTLALPGHFVLFVMFDMKEKEIPPAWATAYDRFGDPSETFTASREGLL